MSYKIRKALSHKDVLMQTNFNTIKSRKEVSLLGEDGFIPIFAAPMNSINSVEHSVELIQNGFCSCVHRYNTPEERSKFLFLVISELKLKHGSDDIPDIWYYQNGVAIGYADDLADIEMYYKAGARTFNLDVASCYHERTFDKIMEIGPWLKDNNCHLIVGNTDNPEFISSLRVRGLSEYVKYVKIGIGSGCFKKGTLIETVHGPKRIEDIQVGDSVYTHMNRLRKVTNTFTHQNKPEFKKVNGIHVTPNHEFYVVHKKHYHKLTDENIHEYAEWVRADQLTKEYFLLKKK